ncbi:MAG TPA: porin family protein [Xanthobacteraceae bacterium]|nr:porin family protein [Xanthobacteraceae bacterium]
MKKLLFATGALAFAMGTAGAADLPPAPTYKAPIAAPVEPSWTGCWISGGVGYGLYDTYQTQESNPGFIAVTQTIDSAGHGWLGRVGVGCDYQIAPSFVIGAFGDYDFMHIHGTINPGALTIAGDMNESSAWAVGGRIGYLPWPNLMTYVDAGWTQTRFDQITLSGLILGTTLSNLIGSNTYNGWFIGGGTEYRLPWANGLFWRTEYRFSSYQAVDLPVLTAAGVPITSAEHLQPNVQTATTSLVWKFNWGGPVVAKY